MFAYSGCLVALSIDGVFGNLVVSQISLPALSVLRDGRFTRRSIKDGGAGGEPRIPAIKGHGPYT